MAYEESNVVVPRVFIGVWHGPGDCRLQREVSLGLGHPRRGGTKLRMLPL
jgi:hypothetical protein